MEGILNHQTRALILAAGVVLALCGFAFFNSAAIMIPAIPLSFHFIKSKERAKMMFGTAVMALFAFIVFCDLRPVLKAESDGSGYIISAGFLLMFFGFLHYLLWPQENRSEDPLNPPAASD